MHRSIWSLPAASISASRLSMKRWHSPRRSASSTSPSTPSRTNQPSRSYACCCSPVIISAYVVDDARYDLGRGSSIWLFPAQQHLLINQSPDFEMWIAVFRRQLVEQTCTSDRAHPALAKLPDDPAPRVVAPDALDVLLKSVESARARPDADAATFNAGLAFALLDAWNRHRAASRSEPVR